MGDQIKIPQIDVKKYGGKQVAIADGKIVAYGVSLKEVMRKAQKKVPCKPRNEIRIFSVPKSLSVIYYV